MRRYNVIEYKSPTDNLSIDDFYKTLGYACLFKGYGTNVNQIPTNELTISIFYEAYPRKMLLTIEMEGHTKNILEFIMFMIFHFQCRLL